MNRSTVWGGAPKGSFKKKLPACKNSFNQAAWDRLKDRYDNAHSDTYERTIYRAMASLAAAKEPISTYKDAMNLQNVGKHCASIICPPHDDTEQERTLVEKPQKRGKKTGVQSQDIQQFMPRQNGDDPAPPKRVKKSAAKTDNSSAPSAKEVAYQKAKQTAMDKCSHPIARGLEWKVILLVDNREQKSEHVLSKCAMSGIPAEERSLPIGDMTWVAQGMRKHRIQGTTTVVVEVEVLLGTIIERKSTSDLVSSFIGTRYNEQRLRLKNAGQPQVLYLIEGDMQRDVHPCIPKERMQMALIETRVDFGFQIVFTSHMDDTVKTLKRFHRRVLQRAFPDAFGLSDDALPSFHSPEARRQQQYAPTQGRRRRRRPESLVEMTFDTPPVPAFGESRFITYEELDAKIKRDREAGTRTVGALHCAMLRQICGSKQVQSIVQDYPTPALLLQAYDEVADNPKTQAELVANCCLDAGETKGGNRRVGPKIARDVYIAYCSTPHPSKRPATVAAEDRKEPSSNKRAKASETSVAPKKSSNQTAAEQRATAAKKPPPYIPLQKESSGNVSNINVLYSSEDDDSDNDSLPRKAAVPWAVGKENNHSANTRYSKASASGGSLSSRTDPKKKPAKTPKEEVCLLDDSSDDDGNVASLKPMVAPRKPLKKAGVTAVDAIEID
ncbi:junction endonuclease MUS81 [Seminavis robusta]|uniref:Crossover junction endonuclease MUS81 n=1 Tax=Seminavis robusta TaxID=568900 RepID=A0A9N8ESA7_9STRA|nr:junction endonuclease MUS81 [Seminavis robusta]|eukprot:Sro1810_g299150.1 junction endonuclease MUS81 (669) ;mRNA; f:15913-18086